VAATATKAGRIANIAHVIPTISVIAVNVTVIAIMIGRGSILVAIKATIGGVCSMRSLSTGVTTVTVGRIKSTAHGIPTISVIAVNVTVIAIMIGRGSILVAIKATIGGVHTNSRVDTKSKVIGMGNLITTSSLASMGSDRGELGMDQCTVAADDKGGKGSANKLDVTAVTSTSQPETAKALTWYLAWPTLPILRA
jgi:hypothetical protein